MVQVNLIFTTLYTAQIFFWYAGDFLKQHLNYAGAMSFSMLFLGAKFYVNSVSTSLYLYCFGNVLAALNACSYDVNSTKLLLEWFPGKLGLVGGLNSAGFAFSFFWSFLAF